MLRRVALLQLDPKVGDIEGNAALVGAACEKAVAEGAQFALSTELVLTGYPPRDLLLSRAFLTRVKAVLGSMRSPIPLLLGAPSHEDSSARPRNSAWLISQDEPLLLAHKQLLPTYEVFDEARYFGIGDSTATHAGFGITICEDAWQHAGVVPTAYAVDPISDLSQAEISAVLNLSSSPYHSAKPDLRLQVARSAAASLGVPFLLANQIGGNDDLIFDGRSICCAPDGSCSIAPAWGQGILLCDLEDPASSTWTALDETARGEMSRLAPGQPSQIDLTADLLDAITLGLRDYCIKSGIDGTVLGLSGGIDSALTAAIAVRALGAENVVGLSMPSRFSSQHSIDDAQHTAETLGIEMQSHPIDELHSEAEAELADELAAGDSVAAENLQARLRGLLVMGVANARGWMALATGNKSELAQGYCTLYGDMAGGYAPLGDLYKTEVYDLSWHINSEAEAAGHRPPISQSTLTKPPSAELAPDQKDEDTLPPYEILDAILEAHIEQGRSEDEIVLGGRERDTVSTVLSRLHTSEHKRWQMPPAPRVSKRAFGQGWRQPLAADKRS